MVGLRTPPEPKIGPAWDQHMLNAPSARNFGNTFMIMVSNDESLGKVAMFTDECPPGGGPPQHVHQDIAETAYVLQGIYKVDIGGELRQFGPGEAVFIPPNVQHDYKNIGDDVGKVLFTVSPGGLDGFFEELSTRIDLLLSGSVPAINEIGAKYQLQFTGPRLE